MSQTRSVRAFERWLFLSIVAVLAPVPGRAAGQGQEVHARHQAIDQVAEIVAADPSFDAAERREAQARIAELRKEPDSLSDAGFELAIARIVATANNAHTQLLPASWQVRFPRLGVRFFIADDGLHVMEAAPALAHLVGKRVEQVDGHDLAELREIWRGYAPGRSGFRDESLTAFLEAPALLHAAGVASRDDQLTLTLGDESEVEVATYDGWDPPQGVWTLLPAARHLDVAAAGLVSGDPLYLREPESFFRLVPIPELDAAYLQFRANVDFSGATDMAEQAAAAIPTLRELAPRYVIVDQRFNIGGDLNTTRGLMQAIPGIVPEDGRIFAITSGRTFSAGIASLGYLVQAADGEVTIVGSPVGDDLEFWAEGGPTTLATGAPVLAATERHNYATGCPEDDCHGSIRRHPIRVDSLDPHLQPEVTWADVIAGRDPYLDAILRQLPETQEPVRHD